MGSAVGAAITNHRVLGPAEARVMATAGLLLLVLSGVAMKWPRVVAIPLSVVLGWVALSLFSRAATLHVEGKGLRWPFAQAAAHPNHRRSRQMTVNASARRPTQERTV